MELAVKKKSQSLWSASSWEDADILCEALGPSCNNGRILSAASSGDNLLALLTINPKEVIAADLSLPQKACFELKKAAFHRLDHPDLLAFLGVTPSPDRKQTYIQLQSDLSPDAKAFWDSYPKAIKDGFIHSGKIEKHLRFFSAKILPWIHSKEKRDELLKNRSLSEQTEFYRTEWNTWLWKACFKVLFNHVLTRYLNNSPLAAEYLLTRTMHAMTQLSTHDNPYLVYILTGNFDPHALPRYLRPAYKDAIATRLDRIKLVNEPLQEIPGPFDGFNLSHCLEDLEDFDYESRYQVVASKGNPGARIAYWNFLKPRRIPSNLKGKVQPLEEISYALHFHDKAWFYQAFHVDEVVSG